MPDEHKPTRQQVEEFSQGYDKFITTATTWNSKAGQVINVDETIAKDREAPTPGKARRLSDYSDLVFFSMAPVYVYAAVPFDIMADFKERTKYDGPHLILQFNHLLLTPIDRAWATIIEGIHKDTLPELTKFMVTQTMLRRESAEYWEVGYQDVDIPDPFAVQQHNLTVADPRPHLRVFLPSGNRKRVGLHKGATDQTPYSLMLLPPVIDVIKRASAVLYAVRS